MNSQPRFLQGVYPFEGRGLDSPEAIGDGMVYEVPPDRRAQLVYFRGGNSSAEMVYAVLTRDGEPVRYFPMGAKEGTHVPLRVVEDLHPKSRIEVGIAAPEGTSGTVVIDVGLVES
jgi:assimilatory nitrate reductase catalytic subunit